MSQLAEWLSVPHAAKFFGLSHWTIRTWARRGVIRRCVEDGQVLVHTADLARETHKHPGYVHNPARTATLR